MHKGILEFINRNIVFQGNSAAGLDNEHRALAESGCS